MLYRQNSCEPGFDDSMPVRRRGDQWYLHEEKKEFLKMLKTESWVSQIDGSVGEINLWLKSTIAKSHFSALLH